MNPDAAVARPSSDLALLAPRFRDAVQAALADCAAAGFDAIVFEAHRSDELQRIYYARGRTVKPPNEPVTNAKSSLYSWHGYSLAVDVIHRTLLWKAPSWWWIAVSDVFKKHGCSWGGDWPGRLGDKPHHQWGRCRRSPSNRARELLRIGGLEAVWREVDAVDADMVPPHWRVLQLGDVGDDVRRIQEALGVHADGELGPRTLAALRLFQQQHGLVVDGRAGRDVRAALGM